MYQYDKDTNGKIKDLIYSEVNHHNDLNICAFKVKLR
jgi:hypothetical protein